MRVAPLLLVLISIQTVRADSESLYSQAVQLTRSGSLRQALTLLTKAADAAPRNVNIQNMLGVVLMQLGRPNEAEEAYNRALSISPAFFPARKNRAVNLFTRGEYVIATKEFEILVALRPTDFVPHLFLGLLAVQISDFPKARKHLVEALRFAPGNGKVILALTRVHLMLGERQLALDCVRRMRTEPQVSDRERFDMAVLLSEFELNSAAGEIFQQLWLSTPEDYDLGFNLALVRYRAGELDGALKVVESLRSRTKDAGELLNLQAWIYNRIGEFDLAETSLRLAIATQPHNADHYLDLSTILRDQGKRDLCIAVLMDGIQRATHRDQLRVQLGLLYQDEGDARAAEAHYRQALNINTACEPAYIALANLLSLNSRQEEAFRLLETSLPLLPKAPLVRYYYGSALLEGTSSSDSAQMEKAARLLEKAAELDPVFARTYYKLGKLYMLKKDYRMAEHYFEMTCALNPRDAQAHYQLGLAAERLGNHKRALELAGIVRQLRQEVRQEEQDRFEDMKRLAWRDRWSKGGQVDRPRN